MFVAKIINGQKRMNKSIEIYEQKIKAEKAENEVKE